MDAPLSQPLISKVDASNSKINFENQEKPLEQARNSVPEWFMEDTELPDKDTEINTIYSKSPGIPLVEKNPEQETINIQSITAITEDAKPTTPSTKKIEKTGFNKVPADSDQKHQLYDVEEEIILKGFAKEDSLKEQITSMI